MVSWVERVRGQGSGLLAAPLALYGPPEELLHVPGHVHGVVQVEVSVCIQDGVAPATGRMFSLKKSSSAAAEAHVHALVFASIHVSPVEAGFHRSYAILKCPHCGTKKHIPF